MSSTRARLRQVDHDLQLRLVVEGQQFHGDVAGEEQHAGGGRGAGDDGEEQPGARTAGQQRTGDAQVEAAERADFVVAGRGRAASGEVPSGEAVEQPGRDHDGDEEREQHRHRGIGRDRTHVGAHQPAHEHHRQQRHDDGERRHDRGIADLVHGLDRGGPEVGTRARPPMPDDVLDHHDGIVDQDADREDQREQAHAVDRVAHQPGGEERQQDGGRDDHQDHDALAPANGDGDEQHDRHRGKREMEQQLVGLLRGRLAVVAAHRHRDVVGQQPALHRLQAGQELVGDDDGIGAAPLGEGHRDHRPALQPARFGAGQVPAPMPGLGGADHHARHVLDIDRPAVARGQQQQADVGHALQRLAGDHRGVPVELAEVPDQEGAVGVGDLVDQLVEGDAVERQALGIGLDADLVGAAADDVAQSHVVDLHQLVPQFVGDLEQTVVGPPGCRFGLGLQRERDDRHVVDAAADDQGFGDALGQVGDVGADLLVDAQQGVVFRGADQEPRGDQDGVVLGEGIDVLDAADGLDDVLERLGDELDGVAGLVAVGGDQDIHHRNADLRLLLARQGKQRQRAHDHRGHQQERRQRRGDGGAGQRAGNSEFHGRSRTSPSRTPARISMPSSTGRPVWTTTSGPPLSLT